MAMETARDFSITRTAMKAEMLDAETELELALAWRDHRDGDVGAGRSVDDLCLRDVARTADQPVHAT